MAAETKSISTSVAAHYNKIEEIGLQKRTEVRIYYLRNFNNWIKSCLINDVAHNFKSNNPQSLKRKSSSVDDDLSAKYPKMENENGGTVAKSQSDGIEVLDLCCGKGGDLLKWSNCAAPVKLLVGVDIADVSIEQCRTRYQNGRNRNQRLGRAEFFTLDCTKHSISAIDKFPVDAKFDISSCQFSLHYGFESEIQAQLIVENACSNVKVGGYFIGTTLNNRELIRRLKVAQKADEKARSFGSEVYQIDFENGTEFPEYGCKYHFKLDGVVNCPEFLCDIGLLTKLVAKHGFELQETFSFREAFYRYKDNPKCKDLLSVINALEPYYPKSQSLSSKNPHDYKHALAFFDECLRKKRESKSLERFSIGTISQSEWEAISVYTCFIFKRVSVEEIAVDYKYDESEILKSIESDLDNNTEMEPPLVSDYFPRKLNYANRK